MDLQALACATQVARHESITAAAAALRVSKATVSKQLARLEDDLGVTLFQRTTRRVQLTPEGAQLLPRMTSILAEADLLQAQAASKQSDPQGLVRIAATPEFGSVVAQVLLPALQKKAPHIQVAMSSQYGFEDLQDPRCDLAIRLGQIVDDTLVARQVGTSTQTLWAHSSLTAAHAIAHPAALSAVPALVFSRQDTSSTWRLQTPDGETSEVDVQGQMAVSSFTTLLRLCEEGHGVAKLPSFLPALWGASVQRVCAPWQARPMTVWVAYRRQSRHIERVRVVLDLLMELLPPLLDDV